MITGMSRARGISANPPAHFEAVEARHHHIEQHQVDAEPNFRQPLDAVRGELRFVSLRRAPGPA